MMRWLLVEAVHTHRRYAEGSPVTVFHNRIRERRGRSKAAVAAAAKLLRIAYWMLQDRMTFEECTGRRKCK